MSWAGISQKTQRRLQATFSAATAAPHRSKPITPRMCFLTQTNTMPGAANESLSLHGFSSPFPPKLRLANEALPQSFPHPSLMNFSSHSSPRLRKTVYAALGVGSVALLGVLLRHDSSSPTTPLDPVPPVVTTAIRSAPLPPAGVIPAALSANPAASAEQPTARPVASTETRQWVEALGQLNPDGTPLSEEQAAAWKAQLQALIQQGAAGLPAIRDFLKLNEDIEFTPSDGPMLGYSSVRNALFDAIRQIGGPEGAETALAALRGTADPREILTLARLLESLAEGEHRQPILDSTRQALSMARRGELSDYDVGPLFEVLQKYGGAAARSDLEQAVGQWKYYGAIGLANLPEGEGIPSLIRMAVEPSGQRGLALELLAQVSLQYPEAKTVLLDQIGAGMITPRQWPYLASVLSGDYYQLPDGLWFAAQNGVPIDRQKTAHIGLGNQNFYKGLPPGQISAEQINQQIALVEEMASAAPDAAAKAALQTARDALNQRLSQLAAPLTTDSP